MKKNTTFKLCFCGIMIALASVLSLVKLWQMPFNGSVTLCNMLPIMLVAFVFDTKTALATSFVYSVIQMAFSLGSVAGWGLSATVFVACLLLDYILAYFVLGLSGIIRDITKKNNLLTYISGMVLAVFLRFICHFVSGVALFSSWAEIEPAWLYSILYNGGFLLADLALCLVVAVLVYKPISKQWIKN